MFNIEKDDYAMFPNEGTQGLKRIREKTDDKYGLEEFKEMAGINKDFEEEVIMKEAQNNEDRMMEEGDVQIPDEESDVSFEENQTDLMGSAIQEEFVLFFFYDINFSKKKEYASTRQKK